jgi:hypothetical protein
VRQVITLPSNELAFRTEGDNYVTNPQCDGWSYASSAIPANQVIGVYQSTIPIPYLGAAILSIRDFMATTTGVLVVVALIVALFALEIIEPSKKGAKPPAEPTTATVTDENPIVPGSEN